MDSQTTGVETNVQNAPAEQGVETTIPALAPQDDPEVRLKELEDALKQTASDRDNYKKVALAAKGKIDPEELDLTDPVQIVSFIRNQVAEGIMATREMTLKKEQEDYIAKMARDLKEAKLALANRSAMVSTGSGSGESANSEAKVGYFSKEQLAAFKARGWDDAKIKKAEENMRRMK